MNPLKSFSRLLRRRREKRQRKLEAMGQAQRNRRIIIDLALKAVIVIMGAIAIGYGLFSFITGSSLFVPRSGSAVLESAESSSTYGWSTEAIRRTELAGNQIEQHSLRTATVNTIRDQFQSFSAGVMPTRRQVISDQQMTVMLDENAPARSPVDSGWVLVTDFCNQAPAIGVETVEMPSGDDLAAGGPASIESDEGTVFGKRAWIVQFTPSPEVLQRLLMLRLYEQITSTDPAELEWVMPTTERQALAAGSYEVERAQAWVEYESRRLSQIDVTVTIEGGASYRLLSQVDPAITDVPDLSLGELPCEVGPDGTNVPAEQQFSPFVDPNEAVALLEQYARQFGYDPETGLVDGQ